MAATITHDGRVWFATNGFPATGLHIGLYTNSGGSLTAASVYSAITSATFTGYSSQALSLTSPTLNGSNQAESDGSTVTFTATATPGSPESEIGYFIWDGSSTLVAFEDFASAISIAVSGDSIAVTVVLTLTQA